MKRTKTIIISRSNDYTGGGFGFTLRHFVIYPPSFSVNDILQVEETHKSMVFRSNL